MAAIARFAYPSPAYAPGKAVKDFLDMGLYALKSDAVGYADASGMTLFQIPAQTLVVATIAQVVTAFNGAIPTFSLGASGALERHIASEDIDLKTTGFYPKFAPYDYVVDTDLIGTLVASTSTTGALRIWIVYRSKSDKQYEGL